MLCLAARHACRDIQKARVECPGLLLFHEMPLLIAFEHLLDVALGELRTDEACNPADGEAAEHGKGTAVNRVDGVAHEHVDDRQAYAPNEASPDSSLRDAFPIESQHEGSKEGSSECTPGDAHQLSDESRRIERYHQADDDEEDDEDTHYDDLSALHLLGHNVVDTAFLHLAGQGFLVAVDEVKGHGAR